MHFFYENTVYRRIIISLIYNPNLKLTNIPNTAVHRYYHKITLAFLDLLLYDYFVNVPSISVCELDLLIIMDSSGSINWLDTDNYDRMKTFINTFLDYPQFDIDAGLTRVGLIYYSDDPRVAFTLGTHQRKIDVENAVRGVEYLGFKTDTSAALRLARTDIFRTNLGDRPNVVNAILILTDGESTSDPSRYRSGCTKPPS